MGALQEPRGEETEKGRARGWTSKNWMLQLHRGSAAAAPALGEMLMGFCKLWSVIGRREFGATSSCRCHWLGAICCSPCRELLAPPPIPFSLAPLPPAAGPLSGTPRPRRHSGAFSPEAGEDAVREWGGGYQPRTDPPALSDWMDTGEVSQETVERPRGRPVGTTPSCFPSRSQRRVRGKTWLRTRVGVAHGWRRPPPSLASAGAWPVVEQ